MFKCTPVFEANRTATEKIIINQGGTSSSKTYSIVQLLILKAIECSNRITITGESIPNLKKGAYRDAEIIIESNECVKTYIKFWNKTDRKIIFKNGSFIEFITNENVQSAKSGKRDYLFVNEANGISYEIFWQLAIRTVKKIFIDYNPSAPFWAHEKLIGTQPEDNDLHATIKLIISDHRHNVFLSKEQHDVIENIKDKDLWRVYARGLTGNLEGLIYPNWKVIPDSDFPHNEMFIGGLDFGYTNDPTAGVKIARIGENIFLHQICYTPGLAPIQIKQLFELNGFTESTPIYCDHDPDQISQLRRLGLYNAIPAKKGQGSINSGIIRMKEFNVYYTSSSINIHEERGKYMWMKDPKTGKSLNQPIDTFNHLMDASRYGVYTHYFK